MKNRKKLKVREFRESYFWLSGDTSKNQEGGPCRDKIENVSDPKGHKSEIFLNGLQDQTQNFKYKPSVGVYLTV